jgi:uncharacterized membrane protein YhaH (DUF805 family)
MYKSVLSSSGRIRRTEYCLSILLFLFFVSISITAELKLFDQGFENDTTRYMFLFLYLSFVYFLILQGAKRCHDLENSGWYQIIPFYIILMIFTEGKYGENKYGENPKGKNPIQTVYENITIENRNTESISNNLDNLEKLKELLDKNIITEEEFTIQKKRILN